MHDPAVPYRLDGLRPRRHSRGDLLLLLTLALLLLVVLGVGTP